MKDNNNAKCLDNNLTKGISDGNLRKRIGNILENKQINDLSKIKGLNLKSGERSKSKGE